MTILKIYVAIGLVCMALVMIQSKVLIMREERSRKGHFVSMESASFLERFLAIIKMAIIFSIPILRIIVTGYILFDEIAQETFMEKITETCDFVPDEQEGE